MQRVLQQAVVVAGLLALAGAQNALSLPDGAELLVGNVRSTFSCPDQYGYFADVDTGCRMFHVCNPVEHANGLREMQHFSFVCGNQTIFDQLSLSCAYPEDAVPCESARSFFYLNERVGQEEVDIHNENDIAQAAPHVPRYAGNWGAPVRQRTPLPAPAAAPSPLLPRAPSPVRNKVARHVSRPAKLNFRDDNHEAAREDIPHTPHAPNTVLPTPQKATRHRNKITQVAQVYPAKGSAQGPLAKYPLRNVIPAPPPTPRRPIATPARVPVSPPPRPAPIPVKETPVITTVSGPSRHPTVLVTAPPSSSSVFSQTAVKTPGTTRLTPREPLRTSTVPLPTEAPDTPTTLRFRTTTSVNGFPTTASNPSFQTTRNTRINDAGVTGTSATETPDVTGRGDNFTPTTDTSTSVTSGTSGGTTLFANDNTSSEETDPPSFTGTPSSVTDATRSRPTPQRSSTKAANSDALQKILSVGPRAEGATKPAGRKIRRKRVKTPSTETTPQPAN